MYIFSDWLAAAAAWALFFLYRKLRVEGVVWTDAPWQDSNLFLGVLIVPLGWLFFFGIFDKYRDIYRLSRLATLSRTALLLFAGCVFLFFTLLLDDIVKGGGTYLRSFLMLFVLHFVCISLSRMIWLTRASRRLKDGRVSYNTLLVGSNKLALDMYEEIFNIPKGRANRFLGYVEAKPNGPSPLAGVLPHLGAVSDLSEIVHRHKIEEVVVAIETSEHDRLRSILETLFVFGDRLLIKISPDMYDIMLGTVKMNHVYGAILIEVRQELMPRWQQMIKRGLDVSVSSLALLLLSPLLLFIALRVRFSSEGPIFFQQERIGLNGKPFTIFKFRSMFVDAEIQGPQLSSEGDNRCTLWGAFMRKWRLDELPQFWNVIRGDMALVGPRPERAFYIAQIMQHYPNYRHLLKVRPGITSWGQVKFGYASTVSEMLQRIKFDLLYIENMSLALDLKILFYTLLVLFQGKGK